MGVIQVKKVQNKARQSEGQNTRLMTVCRPQAQVTKFEMLVIGEKRPLLIETPDLKKLLFTAYFI